MKETIAVTGSGSAPGPPDLAIVNIGVDVVAESVAAAQTAAASDIANILASLRRSGIGDRDLSTTSYSINPEYDHHEGRRLRGYRVSSIVEARIENLEELGRIIDAAAEAGSDHTIVNGLRFLHKNPKELAAQARAAAFADARAKATQLAELAAVGLGPVVSMSEQEQHGGGPPMRAMARDTAMVTSIESGELDVTVTLQIEFGIGPKWA
ncbi:MAG: SIMPL domain-containing protein [bacterium]|nr:SIMPL domain-containing protein [bacterium]MCP4963790.1 SIMPL domain-containing protein [bacterium]